MRQDPVHRGGQAVAHGVAAGIRVANAAIEQQNEAESRPRAGGLLRRALGQGGPRMADNMNVQVETWGETCAALRMTPQRSPFQCDQAGANVAIHDRLPRRRTPYPRFVVMTGAQAARQPQPPNVGPSRNADAGAAEGRGSCAGAAAEQANEET